MIIVCVFIMFRPGMLGGNMGNYPWLADSWPTTNLVHSGKEAVNCCTSKHDTAERYYNGMRHSMILLTAVSLFCTHPGIISTMPFL